MDERSARYQALKTEYLRVAAIHNSAVVAARKVHDEKPPNQKKIAGVDAMVVQAATDAAAVQVQMRAILDESKE